MAMLAIAACAWMAVSCGDKDPAPVEPSGVVFESDALALVVGDTVTLAVSVLPEDAVDKTVTWTSSLPAVASVQDGFVTALSAGNAIITATTVNGREGTCHLTVRPPDIYVVGNVSRANSTSSAVVWQNGVLRFLSDDQNHGNANSVYVVGNDVYAAGHYAGQAALWRNDVQQILSENGSEAYSVHVAGDHVYVAGQDDGKATLWKDGTPTVLSENSSYAYSVYVVGDDVYVAGVEFDGVGTPLLWKNGEARVLSGDLEDAEARSVYVIGDDVYVAGTAYEGWDGMAILWKNDVLQHLSEGAMDAEARSVYATRDEVYVTGYSDNTAAVWKNGVLQALPGESQIVKGQAVCCFNGKVYVAGNDQSGPQYTGFAILWEDGVMQKIHGTDESYAYGIFVK
jgi:hypothetical protein